MDYKADFHAWTQAQAAALRRAEEARVNVPETIDWSHLADELETMGASEQREVLTRLTVLLGHLLKLSLLPMAEPRNGWRNTVREQRNAIADVIASSPSLGYRPSLELAKAYGRARRQFADTYPGAGAPATCPFDLEQEVLMDEWFPPDT